MNILSFDTSSNSLNVCAQGAKGTFVSSFTSQDRRANSHASFLLPTIEYAVEQAGFSIDETEVILCPQGPGSFTGLRIAYSAAKAIQLKTKAKFYCVPVLEAFQFICESDSEECESQILTLIDAKRDCFYARLFLNGKPASESVDSPADKIIEETLKLVDIEKPLTICGIGIAKFKDDMAKNAKKILKNANFREFGLVNLSQIMLQCYISNCRVTEVSESDGPLYIRKSDAEG